MQCSRFHYHWLAHSQTWPAHGFLIPAISLVVVFSSSALRSAVFPEQFLLPVLICSLLIPSSDRESFSPFFGNKVSPDLMCGTALRCVSHPCLQYPLAALISEKIRFLSVSRLHCNGNICCLRPPSALSHLRQDREHIKEIDAPYKEKEQA